MANKRIFLGIGLLCAIAGAVGIFLIEHEPALKPQAEIKTVKKPLSVSAQQPVKKEEVFTKTDLYSNTPYYLPFISISEISKLPPALKKKTDELLENSQGFYYLKINNKTGDTAVILQNPAKINNNYTRHGLQIATISKEGVVTYENIGYSGDEGEIGNAWEKKTDSWEFDTSTEPYRPLKHSTFDKRKKVMYTEIWNYEESEPIKYQMKDSKGKVVSILKEAVDDNANYSREHIFYDENGNIIKSLSANYEGADIKWFTYYDSENPDRNVTIESVYDNGLKVAEKVYNQEFKLEYDLKAEYTDGERTKITLLNSEGKLLERFKN